MVILTERIANGGSCFVDVETSNKAKAVNSIAQDLIASLDTILGRKADFQTTRGTSTQVIDLESGDVLYNVRTVTRRGGHFQVAIYPQTNDAREYLRNVTIDHLPR